MAKSIIQDDKNVCYVCGGRASEEHHVLNSFNRKASEKFGLTVYLCPSCHRGDCGVHGKNGHELNLMLKRIAQKKFEEEHSHKRFMEVFGKNYL